jgi:DNA recombination-dependent growth factor C
MGALNGSISFLRFRVDGEEQTPSKLLKGLEARRFLPLSPTGEVMESAGWVPMMDPFNDDLAFEKGEVFFGERICVTYREDAYKIPRNLLVRETKKRLEKIAEEEKKPRDEMGRAFVKAVEQSVLIELKAKTFPRTKLVDVIWTPKRTEVRVFGKGLVVTERVASLFERTFQVRIELAVPAVRALVIVGDNDENFQAMARLQPSISLFGVRT